MTIFLDETGKLWGDLPRELSEPLRDVLAKIPADDLQTIRARIDRIEIVPELSDFLAVTIWGDLGYRVKIDERRLSMPRDALTGLLAHELSHVFNDDHDRDVPRAQMERDAKSA